jgi:hypothetical protein
MSRRLGGMSRGKDRTIEMVACPCGFHFYRWSDRSWFLRSADGPVPTARVPIACLASFDSRALNRVAVD